MPVKKKKKAIQKRKKKPNAQPKKWSKTNEIVKQKEYRIYIEKKFNEIINEVVIIDFVNISFRYLEQPQEVAYGDIIFRIKSIRPYRRAYINIYPASYEIYKQKHFNELHRAAIHEICHLHTTQISDLAMDRYTTEKEIREATEELTELIAEYIVRSQKKERSNKLKSE